VLVEIGTNPTNRCMEWKKWEQWWIENKWQDRQY
jgi:hypothetical protein